MLVHKKNYLRAVAMVLLLGCNGVLAKVELEPAGLAVYTETARDIYIAVLLLPSGAGVDNVYLAPGPKAMEYRITTRRISSRGFSGTLLLQSELGTGSRAPDAALEALNQLKPLIKSALKQGDQFVIELSSENKTVFYLNDSELVTVPGAEVFNFFFAGWVGENSSAMLRDSLLAGSLDMQLRARYEATQPTAERVEVVVAWNTPPPPPVVKPAPVAEKVAARAEPAQPTVAGTIKQGTQPTVEQAQADASQTATAVATEPDSVEVRIATATAPAGTAKQALAPGAEQDSTAKPAAAPAETQLDDRDYQRQLGEYITVVMQTVYKQVKYPRRAVDKSQEGKVELLAYFDATGELLEVVTDSSSGYTTLDRAAQRAVLSAAPFPKLSKVAQEEFMNEDGSNYVMPIPITFRLQ